MCCASAAFARAPSRRERRRARRPSGASSAGRRPARLCSASARTASDRGARGDGDPHGAAARATDGRVAAELFRRGSRRLLLVVKEGEVERLLVHDVLQVLHVEKNAAAPLLRRPAVTLRPPHASSASSTTMPIVCMMFSTKLASCE